MTTHYLILDIDKTTKAHLPIRDGIDLYAPIKKLELSPQLINFANRAVQESKDQTQYYSAAYVCTARAISTVETVVRLHVPALHSVSKPHENRKDYHVLLTEIIKNTRRVTGLKFLEISTSDDFAIGYLGEGYRKLIQPFEQEILRTGKPVISKFTQNGKIPHYTGPIGNKNPQLESIIENIACRHDASEQIIIDFVEDEDRIINLAKQILAKNIPKNVLFRIYQHDAQHQNDVRIRAEIQGTGKTLQKIINYVLKPRIIPMQISTVKTLIEKAFDLPKYDHIKEAPNFNQVMNSLVHFIFHLRYMTSEQEKKLISLIQQHVELKVNLTVKSGCFNKTITLRACELQFSEKVFCAELKKIMRPSNAPTPTLFNPAESKDQEKIKIVISEGPKIA